MKFFKLFFPKNLKIFLIKNKKNYFLIITNHVHFCILFLNLTKNNYFIPKNHSTIIIKKKKINNTITTRYLSKILKLFISWETLQHYKITFKGKSYRYKKFKKTNKIIFLKFNTSHFNFAWLDNMFVKRIRKNKFVLISKNYFKINFFGKKIANARKLDPYTVRGFRTYNEFVRKRLVRKASYK